MLHIEITCHIKVTGYSESDEYIITLCLVYNEHDEFLYFQGSNVHRIVPDFVVQMGDITKGDGTGRQNSNDTALTANPYQQSPNDTSLAEKPYQQPLT